MRLMGDAIHDQVGTLAQVPGLQLIAGYDTGTSDIRWTAATFARFPSLPHVHIDQGGPGAPVYSANVIDAETGAWSPAQVPGWIARCTAPRPTVYCNRSTLPAVLATSYRGALWLAIPGWKAGDPLPAAPGCTIVAVQNNYDNPAFDLSAVLDPTWPEIGDLMALSYEDGWRPCTKCSGLFNIVNGQFGWGNVCPAGGLHQSGTSGTVNTYVLTVDGNVPAGS